MKQMKVMRKAVCISLSAEAIKKLQAESDATGVPKSRIIEKAILSKGEKKDGE